MQLQHSLRLQKHHSPQLLVTNVKDCCQRSSDKMCRFVLQLHEMALPPHQFNQGEASGKQKKFISNMVQKDRTHSLPTST